MTLATYFETYSFEQVQNIAETLGLKVSHKGDLYMLSFDTERCNLDNPIVREANGVIFEKETNTPVHLSFEKCYDGITGYSSEENKDLFPKEKLDNYTIEKFEEGSLIKLYFYKGEWKVSTSRHIDASRNFWTSKKSFFQLFNESVNNPDFYDTLDTGYCYTYILQHPENRLTYKIDTPRAILVNKVNLSTLKEERTPNSLGISIDEALSTNENYIVYQGCTRIKLLCSKFEEMKKHRGEFPDIALSYAASLFSEKYYELFPEYSERFEKMNQLVKTTARDIHNIYIKKHVYKLDIEIPEKLARTVIQLHGQYRRTRTHITYADAYNKLLSFHPKLLVFIVNYKT